MVEGVEAKDPITITIPRNELGWIISALGASCEFIEDWEYFTLVGAYKDEIRDLLVKLNSVYDEKKEGN